MWETATLGCMSLAQSPYTGSHCDLLYVELGVKINISQSIIASIKTSHRSACSCSRGVQIRVYMVYEALHKNASR